MYNLTRSTKVTVRSKDTMKWNTEACSLSHRADFNLKLQSVKVFYGTAVKQSKGNQGIFKYTLSSGAVLITK